MELDSERHDSSDAPLFEKCKEAEEPSEEILVKQAMALGRTIRL